MPFQPGGGPTSRKSLVWGNNIMLMSLQHFLQDILLMLIKIICAVLALSVMTLATASNISIATLTDISIINSGPSDTESHADDMVNFLAAVTDAIDSRDKQAYRHPDNLHQKHIGLGFALSMNVGSPYNGECNGNGHPGNTSGSGHKNHNNIFDHRNCGDPSPSD